VSAKFLSQADLIGLAADLLAAGTRVVAPVATGRRLEYRALERADQVSFEGGLPGRGLKEFLLPPTEVLLRWRQRRDEVELEEVPTRFGPQVILGARPCDAAGVEVLDAVMGWDYRDELWFGRREATTIVSLSCANADASCFCTSVGLGPESSKGSDLMLRRAEGGFLAEALSAKGEALIAAHAARFGEADGAKPAAAPPVAGVGYDTHRLVDWLPGRFEDPHWKTLALRCHGCGTCAAVCPTCHCFDIVDEPEGVGVGARRRNWDSCQTARFTLHASGHNPRASQSERYRQRVMHKFSIYPKRFGELLCTGCGRCARACPAGMDLPEVLRELGAMAAADGATSGGAK
jgi:ferredoxin